jgi:hypothetical protein
MQGPVAVMLPDLHADANGHASVTSTMPVNSAPQGPLYVNVHQFDGNNILANGSPTLGFRPLLCGDLNPSMQNTATGSNGSSQTMQTQPTQTQPMQTQPTQTQPTQTQPMQTQPTTTTQQMQPTTQPVPAPPTPAPGYAPHHW